MNNDLRQMDTDQLKQAYLLESDKLKNSLLEGARWEDIQDQRHKLIEYEIALYQRIRFTSSASSRSFFAR